MNKWFVLVVVVTTLCRGVSGITTTPAPAETPKETEAVKRSFASFQQAVVSKDADKLASLLTPETMAMFEACRVLAAHPDTNSLSRLSQMEVLIGLQAYWILSREALQAMSTKDFLLWASRSGVLELRQIRDATLANLEFRGEQAVANVKVDNEVATNVWVSFAWNTRKWQVDLRATLLQIEPQLAILRKNLNMSKAEMAVFTLEAQQRQRIPELRELLLSPSLREKILHLRQAAPAAIYDNAVFELGEGRQRDAEAILDWYTAVHTNDQRLAFAQAVCLRSRWSKDKASWQFRQVLTMDPATLEGNCARYVLELDTRKDVLGNMKALGILASKNPDNPLVLWMRAVECRENFNLEEDTRYSRDAEQSYRQMLKLFKIGPVLLHQTFASVLSEELGNHEEALEHRRIAVQQEPASWTYQGLANTLSALKKYDEANEAFKKLVELDPDDALYWHCWAISLSHQDRREECIEKCKKALAVDPTYFPPYNTWAFSLQKLGRDEEALEIYRKAIKINPGHTYAYDAAIRILEQQGRKAEAEPLREQLRSLMPAPAVPPTAIKTVPALTNRATQVSLPQRLRGAKFQTVRETFGLPATNVAHNATQTDYIFKSWHGWDEIILRMENTQGVFLITASRYKGGTATLAEWREAVWRDFGIRTDAIRIQKATSPKGATAYDVLFQTPKGTARRVGFQLPDGAVLDPSGTTLSSVKEQSIVGGKFMILL